jgi:hypothetical protein
MPPRLLALLLFASAFASFLLPQLANALVHAPHTALAALFAALFLGVVLLFCVLSAL